MRRKPLLIGAAALFAVFALYIAYLYRQLDHAFEQQAQSTPTRIYSDVRRIAPPESRLHIEERLKALGYAPRVEQNRMSFTLHPMNYPPYLIPDSHPILDPGEKTALLIFAGIGPSAPLQSIELQGKEVPDLFLEPELVATLTRTGAEGKREIRSWTKFQDTPALVWKAIIAVEDQHFLEHSGLDPRGIARAIFVNLKTFSLAQGGSTITQQLVKNLMARRTRNLFKKVNELFLALILEARFDKEQILERYLNEVYLGQVGTLEVHGIVEGSEYFFGKKPEELNLGEIAMMAGLIRGPGFYSPYKHRERAVERQRLVLKKMVETGQIAEAEAQAALKQPIRLAPPQTTSNKAPYFTDFVKAELIRLVHDKLPEPDEALGQGFRVYTTLDLTQNLAAQRAVAQGIDRLEKVHKITSDPLNPLRIEGALASVDHTTGAIRALVGGRSYAQSTFNRILNMKRQVGSTFKPIVYLAAFLKGQDLNGIPYSPAYPLEDAPWTLAYDHGRQKWAPKNYEKDFLGWIPLRTALSHSINTVAAKLGWEVGLDRVIDVARALGIESELPKVPSLTLGVSELSPIELLRAYAVIANHGVQDELTVIRTIAQDDGSTYARFVYHPRTVIDPAATDLLSDMLESVFKDGTARSAAALGFDRPASGKTGTTSHHRDSWFAGFTPQITTVVWVGLDQMQLPPEEADPKKGKKGPKPPKAPKIRLTGATSALPIWVDFMKAALSGEPPTPFPISPHLEDLPIDLHTGLPAVRECPSSQVLVEKYLKDQATARHDCDLNWPPARPVTTE